MSTQKVKSNRALKIKGVPKVKNYGIPLIDRVLIKEDSPESMTAGGILIPKDSQEKSCSGLVVAVGKGRKDEPMTVKPGDRVLYGQYAGTELSLEGEPILIMRESDILMITPN
jgi:chaperonin GroES